MPLGMAQIVSYLKENGMNIEQDDLYIRIHYDNLFGDEDKRIDEEVFFDGAIFKNPQEFAFIKKVKPIFIEFLGQFNFTEKEALN